MAKWWQMCLGAGVLCLLALAAEDLAGIPSCNEQVCSSRVSKCQLLKSCHCNMTDVQNCSCCYDCQKCLDDLYHECCSCVDLCPASDSLDDLMGASTVVDLKVKVQGLFSLLTQRDDPSERWSVLTYPATQGLLFVKSDNEGGVEIGLADEEVKHIRHSHDKFGVAANHNCTVAYLADCLSLDQCRRNCEAMGATRLRWFHSSCCECVGPTCLDYGKNQDLCLRCSQEYEGEGAEEEGGDSYEDDWKDEPRVDEETVDDVTTPLPEDKKKPVLEELLPDTVLTGGANNIGEH